MRKIFFAVLLCILLMFAGTAAAADEAWIAIDPIPDIFIGEPLVVSGTTNADFGTEFDVVVRLASLSVISDYPIEFSGKAAVINGTAGINFWSTAAGTEKFLRGDDEYEVIVSDAAGSSRAVTYFNLLKGAAPPTPKEHRITVSPVAYPASGESYVFSGTTTAPAGSIVLVDVRQTASTITEDLDHVPSLPLVYETSGVVVAGEHGVNHWAVQSALTPDRLAEQNVRYAGVAFLPEMPKTVSSPRIIPGSGNWTTVDAVANATAGDVIILSGKTNLPYGNRITVEVYEAGGGLSPEKPDQPIFTKEFVNEHGFFRLELDTAGFHMGTYTVVAADAPYLSGPVFSLVLPEERQYIEVDPVPFAVQDSTFTLSGTTGLDDGMQLLIEILPRYFVDEVLAHDSKACYSLASATSKTTTIVKGKNNVNIWSVPIETRSWEADVYVVKVVGVEVQAAAPREEFTLYPENYVPTTRTPSPTETQSPGFAFAATMLAAAAVLLRKK